MNLNFQLFLLTQRLVQDQIKVDSCHWLVFHSFLQNELYIQNQVGWRQRPIWKESGIWLRNHEETSVLYILDLTLDREHAIWNTFLILFIRVKFVAGAQGYESTWLWGSQTNQVQTHSTDKIHRQREQRGETTKEFGQHREDSGLASQRLTPRCQKYL